MEKYTHYLSPDSIAIFLFHGVIPTHNFSIRNYLRKHILASELEDFLQALQKAGGQALSMDECLESLKSGTVPKNSFVITFDDGFLNNLTCAVPILDRFQVPSIFYITEDFVRLGLSSWTDQLEAAFESVATVHLTFPFSVDATTPEDKVAVLNELRRLVKHTPEIDPYEFTENILAAIDCPKPPLSDPFLDKKLGISELRQLIANPLFTLGGHGKTHKILSFLTKDALQHEIGSSVRFLQECSETPVHYAYPDGLPHCHSEAVVTELKKNVFQSGVTAIEGVNRPGDSLFDLKRILVA